MRSRHIVSSEGGSESVLQTLPTVLPLRVLHSRRAVHRPAALRNTGQAGIHPPVQTPLEPSSWKTHLRPGHTEPLPWSGKMLILLISLLLQPDSTDTPPMESMGYEADSLVFSLSSEDLLLVGSASLQYGRMGVSADTIRYESNGELVTAMGNMELTEAGETATGTGLVYHMPTATARTFTTSSFYDRALYTSETVTMLSRDEFNLTNVKFTSCEKDTFDYYFWSNRMKVFPDDKAVAGPVTLYVEETPVFWVPFAVFPIRRGRSSGFTIPTLGSSSRMADTCEGWATTSAFPITPISL